MKPFHRYAVGQAVRREGQERGSPWVGQGLL